MNQRQRRQACVVVAVWLSTATVAAPQVTLELKGASLADTLQVLHLDAQVDFIVDPRVDANAKVTASLTDKPLDQALTLILGQVGHATWELVEGVYLIRPASATAATATPAAPPLAPPPLVTRLADGAGRQPAAPVGRGAEPVGPGPRVEPKYQAKVLYLHYAYAPGLAVLLANRRTNVRGQALLYAQLDPWAAALSGFGLRSGGPDQRQPGGQPPALGAPTGGAVGGPGGFGGGRGF